MASKGTKVERSASIDVVGSAAIALAAAWRGIYHFLGGTVDSWDILPPSDENPDGGLVATGFSVLADYDPNQIVSDIGHKERRLEFFPFIDYVNGGVPAEYTVPQDMTNFMVQFAKGSVEEGTAKTPEYMRTAVANYKAAHNLRTRRGPKRKIIRLDDLESLDETQLSEIPADQLASFLELAQRIAAKNANAAATNAASTTTDSNSEQTEVPATV